MIFQVDIAFPLQIQVAAEIYDWNPRQPGTAVCDTPGFICGRKRLRISHGAPCDIVSIVIVSADTFVQIKKLAYRNQAIVQSLQPVLDTRVIDRPPGESGGGIAAVYVDRVVEDVAACS